MKKINEFVKNEKRKEYLLNILNKVELERYNGKIIFPPKDLVFNAFNSNAELKVVIIGQDPYHNFNQANGLAFSVNGGVKLPPSLKNIFKELKFEDDSFIINNNNGDLSKWQSQGVLLLNDTLTVEKGKPYSHKDFGWSIFTNKVIEYINDNYSNIVFLLWGNFAIKKGIYLNKDKHYILTSPHPSPFSARKGFFGNNHFKLTNEYLIKHKKNKINWKIEN